jgi:outer membrane biosynthesis protein TonB
VPEDLYDEPERRAAERLAAARRLLAQGKLRQALDALNLAIQLAPSNPEAFRARAAVFERMSLMPQAEADLRRADELAAMAPPPPPPVPEAPAAPAEPEPEEEPEPTAPQDTEPEPSAAWRERTYHYTIPQDIPRESVRGVGPVARLAALAWAVAAVGAIGVAAVLVLSGGDGEEAGPSATPFGPTGVAIGSGSATATAEPTAAGSPSTSGDPYSLSALVAAWEAKGMDVEAGSAGQGFSGFRTVPLEVSMSRGGSTSTTSVFVYSTRDAALEDWDLVVGSRPSPKDGRTVPSHVSAWWNANIVVILRTDPGGLGPDALDALINLGG